MDYMGSHNCGILDRDTYMNDPEWQFLNEALKNEMSGVDTSNSFVENDIVESAEEKVRLSDFFTNIFGGPTQSSEPQNIGVANTYDDSEGIIQPASQILQQPEVANDVVSKEQDFVKAIENMDFNDLSDADKDLMYNTANDYIGDKYGDLVIEDRLNEIPKRIKVLDTEGCRTVYESTGDKYRDGILGLYMPSTDDTL